jgi:hypothetical protein
MEMELARSRRINVVAIDISRMLHFQGVVGKRMDALSRMEELDKCTKTMRESRTNETILLSIQYSPIWCPKAEQGVKTRTTV